MQLVGMLDSPYVRRTAVSLRLPGNARVPPARAASAA